MKIGGRKEVKTTMSEKITPSDLKTEAQRLIAVNKMPALDELLGVVAKVRKKYSTEIKNDRRAKKRDQR
jgi:hypothetical protein